MIADTSSSSDCRCRNCGDGCARKQHHASAEEKPLGFFAARPWIWIVVGYLAMLGALGTMVTIAVNHREPDVLLIHGR